MTGTTTGKIKRFMRRHHRTGFGRTSIAIALTAIASMLLGRISSAQNAPTSKRTPELAAELYLEDLQQRSLSESGYQIRPLRPTQQESDAEFERFIHDLSRN